VTRAKIRANVPGVSDAFVHKEADREHVFAPVASAATLWRRRTSRANSHVPAPTRWPIEMFPHHAPIAAVCLPPHPAVIRKMLCAKHKTITVSPGADIAARTGRRCLAPVRVFTKMGMVIARTAL
jgi:hypothetical protein